MTTTEPMFGTFRASPTIEGAKYRARIMNNPANAPPLVDATTV
jgi:hypothetical protein